MTSINLLKTHESACLLSSSSSVPSVKSVTPSRLAKKFITFLPFDCIAKKLGFLRNEVASLNNYLCNDAEHKKNNIVEVQKQIKIEEAKNSLLNEQVVKLTTEVDHQMLKIT